MSKKEILSFFKIKKSYLLNSMAFYKYINLEFTNDTLVGNLFISERIGMKDENDNVKRCNKYYTILYEVSRDKHILDNILEIAKHLLGEKIKKEDIIPSLEGLYKKKIESGISIAVGSSSRMKVCSPLIMIEYIKKIIELYPDENIFLLGNGRF